MRSVLTMLGIIIGVGSVVLMTSIGESMEGLILGQISSLGSRTMAIFPGRQDLGPGVNPAIAPGYDSLTFDDVEALKKLKTIENIAPVITVGGTVQYGREEEFPAIMGTLPAFYVNQDVSAAAGRLPDMNDEEKRNFVVVLGADTARNLFGEQNPLGKAVKIGSYSYTVIGVMEEVGTQFFQNFDERAMMPLSVARVVSGQRHADYITLLTTVSFTLAEEDVVSVLRQRHGITNPDNDDFDVRTSDQANDILGTVTLSLTLFITAIAAISLIVGGIGIMNIMLVSVTERTREIGLRKALGARSRDILLQFLTEAVALTLLGGIIGILGGIGIAAFINVVIQRYYLSTYTFGISWIAIVIALLLAIVTGLVFGVYPARKAAQLSPINALRYE